MRKCRSYDKKFKRDAVKLVLEDGKKSGTAAENLGIPVSTLRYWVWKYKQDPENCFPGKGYLKPEDEELRQIKKKLADVTEERDILKKARAVFSRDVK